jgi:pimeloyl-ACP methyl ester carboxylesterase
VNEASVKEVAVTQGTNGDDAYQRQLRAPLADLHGAMPSAPEWFTRTLAEEPERLHILVQRARIETLAWGQVGQPGLLLMHGNAATADLWRFIAPFFSGSHRVAALSWSGMGGSDWRENYSIETFREEAMATAQTLGLFASPIKPVFAGHSAGGGPAYLAAIKNGDRLAGVLAIDSLVRPPNETPPNLPFRPHRVYPTLAEALARFRFAPNQPCANLYIADMIARASLHEVEGGWTWRFDPALWRNFRLGELWERLHEIRCPITLVNGQYSQIMRAKRIADVAARLPSGTPHILMPESYHHLMVDQPIAFVAVLRAMIAKWQGVSAFGQATI